VITLLPAPQEIAFSAERFRLPRRADVYLSPWEGDDATEEVLVQALRGAGVLVRIHAAPLPGPSGAALVIAADAATARRLATEAARALDRPVPTRVVHTDGPYMADEATLQRRLPAPPHRDRSAEAYLLTVSREGVALCGRSRRGLFWGVQTLRQLLEGARDRVLWGVRVRDWPNQDVRGVHLDMKYMFQKPSAVEDWLRDLAALKLNAALFEYEDKFPYGRYRFLRADSAMTPARLRRVLETARRYHIDVIPLVQSLGHLEFCLRHEPLAHLREGPDIYTQACPTNPASLEFVRDLMDEVLAYHPDVPYFHIGGDETAFLGRCPRCRRAMRGKDALSLYLGHIVPVLEHIIERGKRPILWDDIVRVHPTRVAALPRETILAYWDYGPRRESHGPREIPPALARFYRIGGRRPEVWPDTLSIFPYFDFYRQKGFDVIAAPCLNYGTLVPNYEASAANTMRFAEKSITCGGLGTLNTQWACFRIPFGLNGYGYALTAESTWLNAPADVSDFDMRCSRLLFGMPDTRLIAANRMVAEGVGFRVPGAARPFNLLHFAIMDAEIHYEDGMEGRRRGTARTEDMDFARIVRRKVEMVRDPEVRGQVAARLDRVEAQMAGALALLRDARPRTGRGRLMRDLLAASARFKHTRIGTLRLLLGERTGRFARAGAALRAERRNRDELARLYARSVHPREMDLEMRILFEGELAALERRRR